MENQKISEDYFIGLDIGDTSIGWAVIGEDFNVVRKAGKRLIGTRLFDVGNTAVARRQQRISRRRLERRRERIELLRSLLAEEVNNADPAFFQRLDMSFLRKGDEFGRRFAYNLFDDDTLNDKLFYKRFPTIYHLRDYLIKTDEKADIRWIYLALHHMIKYRGNFLFDGDAEHIEGFRQGSLKEFFRVVEETSGEEFSSIPESMISEAENLLSDKRLRRSERVERAAKALERKDAEKNFKEAFKALTGQKFSLSAACFAESGITGEDGKEVKLSFGSDTYDEEEAKYLDQLGDSAAVLGVLKKLYYQLEFNEILGEHGCLSEAMVARYNEHSEDKKLVKRLMMKYVMNASEQGKRDYKEFFTARPPKNNAICYSNYIKKPAKVKEKNKVGTPEEFLFKKIKTVLLSYAPQEILEEDADYKKMQNIYETRGLMPKLNARRNGAIPYQMHLKELNAILNKQGKFYPALIENAEKIRSLLTFIRPYYVGVLGKNSPNNWYDKEIDGKLYPWNFEEKVNYDYAGEKFISRLVGKCSIFKKEPVLPKQSFLYSEYMVLSELNKLSVEKKRIDAATKKKLYEELFMSPHAKASVSRKDIAEKLVELGFKQSLKPEDISGLVGDSGNKMANILKSRRDFILKLKEKFREEDIPLYEKVVYTNTVFTDTKSRQKRIEDIFKDAICEGRYSSSDIRNMVSMQFSGWGKFSLKALEGTKGVMNGAAVSVIDVMRETTLNFMEIFWNESMGFKEQFLSEAQAKITDPNMIYEEVILPAYTSPAVKKAIYEVVKIVREIQKIMGGESEKPKKIYIESTLGEDTRKKGKFVDSRAKELKTAIDKVISEIEEDGALASEYGLDEKELTQLKERLKDEDAVSGEKYYLWFRQLSKSLYSGKEIPFDNIKDCEVDHIIPRSLIKDDSLENKALVLKNENQEKGNDRILSVVTRRRMAPFWNLLKRAKLMGKKKFDNLMRSEWKDSDIEGFINRQLVETSQIIKEVQKILEQIYGNPSLTASSHTVTPVRAKLSDEFKRLLGYYKIRELNNFHHAKDAYAVAVLGRFCDLTVKQNTDDFRERLEALKAGLHGEKYSDRREENLHGIILDLMFLRQGALVDVECDGEGSIVTTKRLSDAFGEITWDTETLERVRRNMFDNRILFTKKIEKEAHCNFYDQNARASQDKPKIPLRYVMSEDGVKKPLPPEIYGGYSSENDIYTVIVEYDIPKGKRLLCRKSIIGVPARIHALGEQAEKEYIIKSVKTGRTKNAVADTIKIVRYLYVNQMLKIDGQLCFFMSTGEVNNAVQIGDETPQYNPETGEYETLWQEAVSLLMKAKAKKKYLPAEEEKKYSAAMEAFVSYYADALMKKCPLYYGIGEKLTEFVQSGKFADLDYNEKQDAIREIVKIASIKEYTGKLTPYNIGNSNVGRLVKSVNDDTEIVDRSITGFWERTIKIDDIKKSKDDESDGVENGSC